MIKNKKNCCYCVGDVAVRTCTGEFRLLGRQSSDIIKSSGYKLSALEVEREILSHPQVIILDVISLKMLFFMIFIIR